MWRLLLFAGATSAAFGGGWYSCARWNAGAAVQQAAHTITVVQKQGAVNTQVAQAAQAHQDQTRTVTKTLIQRVPVYVTNEADAQCSVPDGAISVLDAAAAGAELPPAPEGSGDSDATASAVDLRRVVSSVTMNYGAANATRQQLMDLQAWVRQQGLAGK